MDYQLLKSEQKALEINLNDKIYGTFAEIGAGQEVARNFFQAGAAANTIAKTMSAYDKTYSDAIYGTESSGRYICESRLYKMLHHEWALLDERLSSVRPDSTFFVFADTVTTINYTKTTKGKGWLGLRFQLRPGQQPNDMVVHVKMHDNDTKLQQEAVGLLGVNLIYSAFFNYNQPELLIKSLHDGLNGRVSIDLVRLKGPDFTHLDNRLLSLYLVKHGLTEVAIFDENKNSIHASEFLYRKSLMVVRGNFKPPTLVTLDVIKSGFDQFNREPYVDSNKSELITELTLDYLKNENGDIPEIDFLERADLLNALGHKVLISNCNNHQMLINYMADHKIENLGLLIGVRELLDIMNEKYEQNQDGRLLVAFGELFTRNIKIYAYPSFQDNSTEILTSANLPVPSGIKFLYKHLIDSQQIVDITDYNPDLLHIFPNKVLKDIKEGGNEWKKMIPEKLVEIILEKGFFGYSKNNIPFEV